MVEQQSPPPEEPGRNLIVNYLPQNYTESDLLNLFKPYGQIETCKIVIDRASG
jgi:ELAV like protein 2/3/4